MSNPTLTMPADIVDSAQGRASAFVPTNQRVSSKGMPLSVQTDVPTFPGSPAGTVTGTWIVAGMRVSAAGIALVNGASSGVGYTPVPVSSGPLQILPGNRDVTVKF
jgi:hypothetical protein